jgi:hypothetical protein
MSPRTTGPFAAVDVDLPVDARFDGRCEVAFAVFFAVRFDAVVAICLLPVHGRRCRGDQHTAGRRRTGIADGIARVADAAQCRIRRKNAGQ